MAIRSGRFKGDASVGITIVSGRAGAFYRIFNSGDRSFVVNAGNSDTTLERTMSLDVVVVQGDIVIKAGTADVVEGIYEFLDGRDSIRSGRFKLDAAPSTPHKIIDFTIGGKTPKAVYRIFNSGEKSFNVLESDSVRIEKLKPAQSCDFVVDDKRDIFVVAAETQNPYPIEGIYEFLGSVD